MKSEILSQERNIVVVKAEYETEEVNANVAATIRELSSKANIKGFRKGHVPRKTLELFFGRPNIYKETIERMASEALDEIIREYELDLIADPKLTVGKMEEGAPMTIDFTFEVRPEVTLPDFSTITVDRKKNKIDDEFVEKGLAQFAEANAEYETVTEDRAVLPDDFVVVEYDSILIGDDGAETKLEEKKQSMLHLKTDSMRDELIKAIVGRKITEEFSVDVTLEQDYPNKDMAGKTIRYMMELIEIKQRKLLELTDENIDKVSDGKWKTVDDLKAAIRSEIEADFASQWESEFRDSVIEAVVAASELETPEGMVDRQKESQRRGQEAALQQDLGLTLEEYLTKNQLNPEQYDADMRKRAEATVRNTLVIEEVIKRENIECDHKEVDAELDAMAAAMRADPSKLKQRVYSDRNQLTSVISRVTIAKAIDWILSQVNVNEVEGETIKLQDGEAEAAPVQETEEAAVAEAVAEEKENE